MQQRRLRPGDVLDDYCPRERRITDHAIVAMIDDEIKQTRCVSCDTEHEYKQAKVPPQRRKKAQAALFTQVLDGLQGPVRRAQHQAAADAPLADADEDMLTADETHETHEAPALTAADEIPPPVTAQAEATSTDTPADRQPAAEEGPVRRSLIRAQLPRHEGQQMPTRELPDFTIRQPTTSRGGNRPGGHGARPGGGRRRGGAHPQHGQAGATQFGGQGGRGNQFGRSNDRRHAGRQGQGQGHGQARPHRDGRRGGGKKH